MKILVFGGSSGIGKAVAEKEAEIGNQVFICSRNQEKLVKAAGEIGKNGTADISTMALDLGETELIKEKIESIVKSFGVPDAVLLNGGGPPFGNFNGISLEQWKQSLNEIFLSNIIILQSLLPILPDNTSIVCILSDVIRNSGPGKSLPCSLRLALMGLISCISGEYTDRGIRLNALSPGPVETGRAVSLLQRSAQNNGVSFDEQKEVFVKSLPLKRMGTPAEIAETVSFLFSPESSYINGINLPVDGGLTGIPL